MNILLINHYAGSPLLGMEYRPHAMARAWVALGHRPRIVAATFSHVRSVQPHSAKTCRLEMVEGVEYLWIPTPPYQGNGLGRVRNMAAFVWGLIRDTKDILEGFKPDAVVSSSTYPLDVVGARHIAARCRARFFHEVHDLWPLSPMELGQMSPRHPFIVAMQWAENQAYRHAHRVISMLPKAEAHMREHGLAPGKFVYVPNGIDIDDWEGTRKPMPPGPRSVLDAFRARHRFLVGYAGAHGLANALDALIEATRLMVEDGVGVVLVGQGPEKARLQDRAAGIPGDHVLFLDAIPKHSIPALLDEMDALYIGLQRQPLFRFGVSPNKLMDYMMAGKPVIHAIDAGNDLVREADCGISIPPEDPARVADAVRRLGRQSGEERNAMGARGRAFVLAEHAYPVLAARFAEALRE